MATVSIGLDAEEIKTALRDYVRIKYSLDPGEVTLSASISSDMFDRPTGGHMVSATVNASPRRTPSGIDK